MNKRFYLQHGIMAIHDPRMQAMVEQEGSKGYGTYWYIMEKLNLLPDCRAGLTYLKPFACRRFTFTYMMRIVREFELFTFGGDFFVPVELNVLPVDGGSETDGDSREKAGKNVGKSRVNEAKSSENDGFSTENGVVIAENANFGVPENECNGQRNSDLQDSQELQKENIRVKTASAEKEEEKTAAADPSVQSLRPWQELVDSLRPDSEWAEVACMKSGYGRLLAKYFSAAVQQFKQHVLLYGKGGGLLTLSDVHQYFANYTASGSRTSNALHEVLLKLDAAAQSSSPDPYRHEQRIGGRRTYMGCPIPDNAPPRPDGTAIWNVRTEQWVSLRKHGQSAL